MATSKEQLSDAVTAWAKQLTHGCTEIDAKRLDELTDQVMRVATARLETGDSVQDALRAATERLGSVEEIRRQLSSSSPWYRRWFATVFCSRSSAYKTSTRGMIGMSLVIAAALLISAWLSKDEGTYSIISTTLIGFWVVLAFRGGGSREAARAEWRWIKSKFGK